MTEPRRTDGELEHFAQLVQAAWRRCGPGGAYFTSVTTVLPDDLDVEELRPWLDPWGVPLPVEPEQDPRYRGLAQIADA